MTGITVPLMSMDMMALLAIPVIEDSEFSW